MLADASIRTTPVTIIPEEAGALHDSCFPCLIKIAIKYNENQKKADLLVAAGHLVWSSSSSAFTASSFRNPPLMWGCEGASCPSPAACHEFLSPAPPASSGLKHGPGLPSTLHVTTGIASAKICKERPNLWQEELDRVPLQVQLTQAETHKSFLEAVHKECNRNLSLLQRISRFLPCLFLCLTYHHTTKDMYWPD